MVGNISPIALFRLSVLGPLASREELGRGEVKGLIRELADRTYHIPNSNRTRRRDHRGLVLRLETRGDRGSLP